MVCITGGRLLNAAPLSATDIAMVKEITSESRNLTIPP
jgi:hypothetical protein